MLYFLGENFFKIQVARVKLDFYYYSFFTQRVINP